MLDTTLRVASGDLLLGKQTLDATFDGRSLVLGAGTHTVVERIELAELTMLDGAKLTAPIEPGPGLCGPGAGSDGQFRYRLRCQCRPGG